MGRTLCFLGIVLLAAAVWLILAGATGWVREEVSGSLAKNALVAGLACLGSGLLAGLLDRLSRPLRRGRCARCGGPTERGQTYCLDHLLATVEEYRDKMSAHDRTRGPASGRQVTKA